MAGNKPHKRIRATTTRQSLPRNCKQLDQTYNFGGLRALSRRKNEFLSLPGEIRDTIYRFLFDHSRVVYYYQDSDVQSHHEGSTSGPARKFVIIDQADDECAMEPSEKNHNAILRTCKSCYFEAINHYYAQNHFVIANTLFVFASMATQQLEQLGKAITSLELTLNNPFPNSLWPKFPNLKKLTLASHTIYPCRALIHTTEVEESHLGIMLSLDNAVIRLASFQADITTGLRDFRTVLPPDIDVVIKYSYRTLFVFRNNRKTFVYTSELWQRTASQNITQSPHSKYLVTRSSKVQKKFLRHQDFKKLEWCNELSDEV